MFNLGITELLLIFGVALLVLGPNKLPEVARMLGKGLREFRRTTRELEDELNPLRDHFDNDFFDDDDNDNPSDGDDKPDAPEQSKSDEPELPNLKEPEGERAPSSSSTLTSDQPTDIDNAESDQVDEVQS